MQRLAKLWHKNREASLKNSIEVKNGRGPDAPHIGWQTPGKNNTGGHIILDDVPTGRSKSKTGC